MRRLIGVGFILLVVVAMPGAAWSEGPGALEVYPTEIRLDTPESSEQLLVFDQGVEGVRVDVTRHAAYQTQPAGIVSISPSGRVIPLHDGRTEILIKLGNHSARIPVEVRDLKSPRRISFRREVVPILSKAGCNAGGCHGKAEGQNGFKLSVFGYDAVADHQAIVLEGRGRRVFPAAPDKSLLLSKATARTPHGGGQKLEKDSRWYARLRRWISEGLQIDDEGADPIEAIAVEPAEVTLASHGSQQLRVTTRDRSGQRRCVTVEAQYQSNNPSIAEVDSDGLIHATDVPGEAAILVRYLGHVTVCRVTRPRPSGELVRPAERNFIDALVWDKLARLRLSPSPPATTPPSCGACTWTRSARCRRPRRPGASWPTDRPTEGAGWWTDCSTAPSTPTTGPSAGATSCRSTRTPSLPRGPSR